MNRTTLRQGRARPTTRLARSRMAPGVLRATVSGKWSFTLHASLILLILVFVGRAQEAIPGMGGLPWANVAVLLVAGCLAAGGYLKRLPLIFRTTQLRLALALLVIGALSVPFALWPGGAATAWIDFAKVWILCVILPLAIVTIQQLSIVTRIFAVATAVLIGGYVIEAFLGLGGFTQRQGLGFDRNGVALYAVMGLPYALAWAASDRRARILGFCLAGFLMVGVVATGSRGGFLAMAAVGTVFLVRSRLLSAPKKMAIVLAAVALAAMAGSGEYWDRVVGIFAEPTEDYNFQSRYGRIEVWKRGLTYAAEHPITGVGFQNFPVAEGAMLDDQGYGVKWSTAHNAYILVLAELGVPGFIVFLALLWSIVHEATRTASLTRTRAPPGREAVEEQLSRVADATRLAFLGYAVAAIFLSASYSVAPLFLASMGAALAILRRRSQAMRIATWRRAGVPAR